MENEELREKLLCAIKNNIQDFEYYSQGCYRLYNKSSNILFYNVVVYKDTLVEKEFVEKPKYFWQKPKTRTKRFTRSVFDYPTADVKYGDYATRLTKEEYEEIMQIRQEKIKEKQLKELEKLCNKEQN